MSSIRNITASTAVPDDLAKRLGPSGVNEILLILWQGYHDIIADTNITITENTEEDDITQEWYGKISLRLIFAFVIGILQTVILVQNAKIYTITRKIKSKDMSKQELKTIPRDGMVHSHQNPRL